MADIAVNAVFSTAKFITTNNKGDLQEVVADAVSASKDIDGLTFSAVTGVNGNNLSIIIEDSIEVVSCLL